MVEGSFLLKVEVPSSDVHWTGGKAGAVVELIESAPFVLTFVRPRSTTVVVPVIIAAITSPFGVCVSPGAAVCAV